MPQAERICPVLALLLVCGCTETPEEQAGDFAVSMGGAGGESSSTSMVTSGTGQTGGQDIPMQTGTGGSVTPPPGSSGSAGSFVPPTSEPPLVPLTFTASSDDFLNPERGFHADEPLPADAVDDARASGLSLIRSYVVLDRSSDAIAPSLLNGLAASLKSVRDHGLKIVLRFSYGLNAGPDAPQSRILSHIAQLKPTLQANADILLALQAGFIGQWGEWHDSTNGLDNDASRGAILTALLDAVPASRMVEVRYPWQLRSLLPGTLSDTTAFSGTNLARVGLHDDCFVADDTDSGTYWDFNGNKSQEVADNRSYAAAETRYVPMGGETCNNAAQSACTNATQELAKFHFTYLNNDFNPDVNARWRSEGCMPEIRKRLGYRFEIERVSISEEVAPGGLLYVQWVVKNVGYAAPFNARPIFVVLDGGGQRRTAALAATDWRRWSPEAGEVTVSVKLRVPDATAPGTYRVALWLPDAASSLRGRVEYAVRFANTNVWNAAAGDNTLTVALKVNDQAKGDRDTSAQTFAVVP
jgi:hypothetical protein